jgi:ABC-type Mn2+/Zn2+ transport system permease subunit
MIGMACSVAGVLLSAFWDIPSGPAIVLLSTLLFFISIVLSPKRLRPPVGVH